MTDSHAPQSQRRTSRRSFLAAAGTVGTAAVAGCLGGLSGSSSSSVSVLASEAYDTKGFRTAVSESIDTEFEVSTVGEDEFVTGTPDTDSHDVVVAPHPAVETLVADGETSAVPTGDLSNYGSLYGTYRTFASERLGDSGESHAIPVRFDWTGYAYDADLLPPHEASWSNLFDGIPGTYLQADIAMLDDPQAAIVAAAFHRGFADSLSGESFSLSEKQRTAVSDSLTKQQQNFLWGYLSDQQSFVSGMNDDEFLVAQTTQSSAAALWESGNSSAVMTLPSEGAVTTFDAATVVSDDEAAWQVADAFVGAKAGAELAVAGGLPSTNPNVNDHLEGTEKERFGAVESDALSGMLLQKPIENADAWTETFEAVKTD